MNETAQWLSRVAQEKAAQDMWAWYITVDSENAKTKWQLCLTMIAGGDSPERTGERLNLNLKVVDTIIMLDIMSRSRRRG